MRILLVNSERGVAGGLTSALDLAGGLARSGHTIAFICHPESELRRRLEALGEVTVEPVGIRAELNLGRSLQIAGVMKRFQPDVVIADRRKDVKLTYLARFAGGLAPLVHRHGAPSPLRDGPVYRAVWRRLSGMIVNSATMRELLLATTPWLEPVPIDVIHNGKDLDYWRPLPEQRTAVRSALGIAANAFVVSYHGVLQPRKRVDLLIRAASLFETGRVHLLVIGGGEAEASLRSLASSLGVSVTFTGQRHDLPSLLCAADVAAHLSVAEGFSNSVVEALACGLPVIASDASSHREQIDPEVTGILVQPDDAPGLAAALSAMATDPGRTAAMRAAARRLACERFGIERMVHDYEAALERAVRRGA